MPLPRVNIANLVHSDIRQNLIKSSGGEPMLSYELVSLFTQGDNNPIARGHNHSRSLILVRHDTVIAICICQPWSGWVFFYCWDSDLGLVGYDPRRGSCLHMF